MTVLQDPETGMMTVQAVAARLNVSTSAVYNLIRSGDLRAVNLATSVHGGKALYRVNPLWLEAFLVAGTTQPISMLDQTSDQVLQSKEAAELLGVTDSCLKTWRFKGTGPAYSKRGKMVQYRMTDVVAWKRNHPTCPEVTSVAPEMRREANTQANNAVRWGRIPRRDACEVCNSSERLQMHHTDYYKPLDVNWLCANCHTKVHTAVKEIILLAINGSLTSSK